ncbi:MAG: hypothetical protein PHO42_03185 [Candidatus Omnitrophica bacterium]|nr:hypothetical protein [Candidatus Omnitrophota bacterium]
MSIEGKKCAFCGKEFTPSKYRPNQTACPAPECQRQRQIQNIKEWRSKHKGDLDPDVKEARKQKYREWRSKHQEYLKLYKESRRDEYRTYMRDYMKKYRKKKAGGTEEAAAGQP